MEAGERRKLGECQNGPSERALGVKKSLGTPGSFEQRVRKRLERREIHFALGKESERVMPLASGARGKQEWPLARDARGKQNSGSF